MTPILNAAAVRLLPLLGRIGQRAGSFLGPSTRMNMVQIPEVGPVTPAGPAPPISVGSSPGPGTPTSPPMQKLSTPQRINGGFDMFGPEAGNTPMENSQWPTGPVGAPTPAAPQAPAVTSGGPHQPIFTGPQLPQSSPDTLSAWQRNAALQRDGLTGDYIDPTNAARADATGPELIQKMMGYFNRKERA